MSVISRTHPEVLGFFWEAFTYAKSLFFFFFHRKLYRENQNENLVQTWRCVFSLPSTLSDLIWWEKGLFVSLKQASWFHLAHGDKEGREVGDKGFGVRVTGWGCLIPDRDPKILTRVCLSPSCYLMTAF